MKKYLSIILCIIFSLISLNAFTGQDAPETSGGTSSVIDNDSTEAFLVRKDGDVGDVLTVDTVNEDVDITTVKIASGSITDSTGTIDFGNENLTTTGTATLGAVSVSGGGTLSGTWTSLGTVTTIDINGGTIDSVTIGGASAGAGTFTTVTASSAVAANGGITFDNATDTIGAHTLGGAVDHNNENSTNVDIDSGAIDGTIIGANSAAAGTFTTVTANTSVSTDTISEVSAANGVAVDGLTIKDNSFLLQFNIKTTTMLAATESGIILCDSSGGNVTLTLPAVSGNSGLWFTVKNTGSNDCVLDGNASETIDGSTTKTIASQYGFYKIITDGSSWHIVATNLI